MWNDWLEKGKSLAATIDKQLNESVGMEQETGTTTASSTSPTAEKNAWNDDDFGDAFADDEAPSAIPPPEPDADAWAEDEELDFDEVPPKQPPDSIASQSLLSPTATAAPAMDEAGFTEDAQPPVLQEQPTEPELEPEPTVPEPYIATSAIDEPVISLPGPESFPDPVSQGVPEETAGWEEELYDDDDGEDVDDEVPVMAEPKLAGPIFEQPVVDEEPIGVVEQPPPTVTPPVLGHVMPMTPATALVNESIGQIQQDHQQRIAQIQDENNAQVSQLVHSHQTDMAAMQQKLQFLQASLQQREDQLASKAEQMASMASMHEREKEDLLAKIKETKEEAMKRIQSAKERVETMEAKLKATGSATQDAAAQEEIIVALREEGGKLARKQADMEKAVRAAKMEARDLLLQLQRETETNEKAQEKIAKLEADYKDTKAELAAARKGETMATKLENEVASLKEELERKTSANLELNQQVKELKSKIKELKDEVAEATRGALLESKRESSKIKREHGDLLTEMELKLRASEREASVREDALRQEVSDLRKRWQDAVRRADALSMDVQNSTAPLLRQLESMERQSRSRAAVWAELETKLRTDLEDSVIELEKATKERNEFKMNHNRLQRMAKERDEELFKAKSLAEDSTAKVEKLESALLELETDCRKREEEYSEVERLANEGVSKVRSDMMKTVVESEERYRAQMESLENDLKLERNKRSMLEEQVQKLLENVGLTAVPLPSTAPTVPRDKPPKKLRASEGQADILASTLAGLGDESGDEYETDEDLDAVDGMNGGAEGNASGMRSFAAMEELSQRLKASTVELEALRSSLANSEKTRTSLVEELADTRQAKEKLPFFEAKVRELTEANREMELEIRGLQDDINDTRQLYRMQLNGLLEEKASHRGIPTANGKGDPRREDVVQDAQDNPPASPAVAEKYD